MVLNERCAKLNVFIPNLDGSARQAKSIALERVRMLFFFRGISVHVSKERGVDLDKSSTLDQSIVKAMGSEWELMYNEAHIKQVMARYLEVYGQ